MTTQDVKEALRPVRDFLNNSDEDEDLLFTGSSEPCAVIAGPQSVGYRNDRDSKQNRITELHYWLKTRINGKNLILIITDNAVHNIARIVENFLNTTPCNKREDAHTQPQRPTPYFRGTPTKTHRPNRDNNKRTL
jgi:hypothetical protein